uniref:PHD-type domain-containing protein n=1 Tax=Vannella robusta TaxID=1487602 RepID=A0A7S4IPX0_9EUKA
MSTHIKWKGRKWTGSPRVLRKQAAKEAKKNGSFAIPDPSDLENSILFGWYFECKCGASGSNYCDEKRSLQCDVCKVWMHCSCNGVPTRPAELMQYFRRYIWICPNCKEGNYKYRSIHWKEGSQSDHTPRLKKIKFQDEPEDIETNESNDNTLKKESEELKSSLKERKSLKKVMSVPDLSKMPSASIIRAPKKYEDGITLPNPDSMGNNRPKLKRTRSLRRVASSIRTVYMENIYAGDI